MIIKENLVKNLIRLYTEYKNIHILSVPEFINYINKKTNIIPDKSEIDYFLELTRHESFVEHIAKNFIEKNFMSYVNKIHVEVIIFLIIFVLDNDNLDTLLASFLHLKCTYLCNLLEILVDSDHQLLLCQIACKLFEDDYVLENIIYPLLNKISIICILAKKFEDLILVKAKPNTKPKMFVGLSKQIRKIPPPPSNTPLYEYKFKAARVPKSTYKTVNLEIKLDKIKKENRDKAEQLLIKASRVPERLTKVKVISVSEKQEKIVRTKETSIPVFKNVEVKSNLTTTLREASKILKNKEDEVKKIEDLLKGGFSGETIEKIEEEIKKENEIQQIKTIERNHLKGLMSYEDAILAKRKLLQKNKEKMERFKEDRIKVVEALDRWREEEEQKIKALVEKSQNIKLSAKESEQKMLERKREQVRIQQYETKQMLEQAFEEKMKELNRKAEIIEELRALHQVRFNNKEFDPTETANMGLLCEMSLAELQERLAITKMNMQQELERKRKCILKAKEKHRQMLENIQEFISQNRHEPKRKVAPSRPVELEESPDLTELRKLLEEKRKLRNNNTF